LADVERANVIEPENVVGMTVRQQYSVEAFQSDPQGLLTEVRRSVNQHVPAAAGDQHRGTQPLIARIVRLAHAARASERGDAHGSTRSKDRDFYRSGRHVESNDTNRYAEPGRPPRFLRAGFGLSFGGLGSNRLIDLEKGHLQFAEEVQE